MTRRPQYDPSGIVSLATRSFDRAANARIFDMADTIEVIAIDDGEEVTP